MKNTRHHQALVGSVGCSWQTPCKGKLNFPLRQEQHEAISHGDSAHREATRVSSVYGRGDAGRRALLSLPCTWDVAEMEQKQNSTTRAHNGTNNLLS